MKTEDLLEFVNRDRTGLHKAKREAVSAMTAAERLAKVEGLRQHMLTIHPDWPTPEMREADLESHIRVSELLRQFHEAR